MGFLGVIKGMSFVFYFGKEDYGIVGRRPLLYSPKDKNLVQRSEGKFLSCRHYIEKGVGSATLILDLISQNHFYPNT